MEIAAELSARAWIGGRARPRERDRTDDRDVVEHGPIGLGRAGAEGVGERRDLEALAAQGVDRWHDLVSEVRGDAVILYIGWRAQVVDAVRLDVVAEVCELV